MNNDDNMKRYALIGKGISYSLSKVIHEKILKMHGIDKVQYDITDIDNIKNNIDYLRETYLGFNVTKPYKVEIIDYLDEIDDDARKIGSVNTVINLDGKLKGYNTDIDGIEDTFLRDDVDVRDKIVLVIGYGGVSKTVIFAMHKMGARAIYLTGRNVDKMYNLISEMKEIGIDVIMDRDLRYSYDIVINATSVGTNGVKETPIDVCQIADIEYYFDLIYSPRCTYMCDKIKKKARKVADGLYMLVSQAAKSDHYYANIDVKKEEIFDVYLDLAGGIFKKSLKNNKKRGICLLGFMGAGKTTIGKALSNILDIDIVDQDEEIARRYGAISDIFKNDGEDRFRDIETQVLRDVIDGDIILSTGGGVVMKDENIELIRSSDMLKVFIDVPFEVIKERVKGSNRPLFRTETKARELYDFRYSIYRDLADIVIDGDRDVKNIIDDILKY